MNYFAVIISFLSSFFIFIVQMFWFEKSYILNCHVKLQQIRIVIALMFSLFFSFVIQWKICSNIYYASAQKNILTFKQHDFINTQIDVYEFQPNINCSWCWWLLVMSFLTFGDEVFWWCCAIWFVRHIHLFCRRFIFN